MFGLEQSPMTDAQEIPASGVCAASMRIGQNWIEALPIPACGRAARNWLQLFMDLHGAGLERMLEIVARVGDTR